MRVALAVAMRPPSVNGSGKHRTRFAAMLRLACPAGTPAPGLLSGVVCWFVRGYNPNTDPDADNISKAVWDDLGGIGLYGDDRQIRVRVAAIVDLFNPGGLALSQVDLRGLPRSIIESLDRLAGAALDDAGDGDLTVIEVRDLTPTVLSACFGDAP